MPEIQRRPPSPSTKVPALSSLARLHWQFSPGPLQGRGFFLGSTFYKERTMTAQHTPGPWTADKLQDRDTFNIFANGFVSAMCQVSRMENSTRSTSGNETAANARLIAAAPELLEFAKEWLDRQGTDENYMVMKARAAIAKAKGAA
jgi:hypothetical protein